MIGSSIGCDGGFGRHACHLVSHLSQAVSPQLTSGTSAPPVSTASAIGLSQLMSGTAGHSEAAAGSGVGLHRFMALA